MNNLTKEEKEILESFEKSEWHSRKDLEERKRRLQEYAKNTLEKNKRVNITNIRKR